MKKLFVVLLSAIAASGFAQTISYTHPDAAAPGMIVYTELIGPDIAGNFGSDGLGQSTIEFVNPGDALRMIVAPTVTSSNGRVVSLVVLVPEGAQPGAIPFRILSNGQRSNVDTFYIVQPQTLNVQPGAALGSGGQNGVRSRRNTLVVESLTLPFGTYSVSDLDPDPLTPGNQAYLPFTIISKGPVRINGHLSVSGMGINAVAGGGGGGARASVIGGNGFTAGGGDYQLGGVSSGGVSSTGWDGANALNGAPGGGGLGDRWFDDQGAGGGTGFPFGSKSRCGTWWNEGGDSPDGGVGGGSGGGERWILSSYSPDSSFGGGGGGYATDGECSGSGGCNGGKAYGNCFLVPFCGGSGGGAGNQYGGGHAGSGGAGGGAIHIVSMFSVEVMGSITADGADGESTQNHTVSGGGGGGSGGAIALTAPIVNVSGQLSVRGGNGGTTVHQPVEGGLDGGHGGEGRIRVIGLSTACSSAIAPYQAPSITQAAIVNGAPTVSGIGRANDSVTIVPVINGTWQMSKSLSAVVDEAGHWQIAGATDFEPAADLMAIGRLSASATQNATIVVSPNVVKPTWLASGVSDDNREFLAISSVSHQSNGTTIRLTGLRGQPIEISLFDILGRKIEETNVAGNAEGSTIYTIRNNVADGSYFLVATNANQSVSKAITVLH